MCKVKSKNTLMFMIKKNKIILLLAMIILRCCPSMAQYDTIYRNIKELRVEKKSFLRSLKSASKKDYFCNMDGNTIYTIKMKDNQEGFCTFSIVQYCLTCRMLRNAKGYFKLNSRYYFVLGSDSLSEYPERMFVFTDNQKEFMDVTTEDIWSLCGSDCSCAIDFEFKKGKLYFLRNSTYVDDWQEKLPLKEISLPDSSLEKRKKQIFNRK